MIAGGVVGLPAAGGGTGVVGVASSGSAGGGTVDAVGLSVVSDRLTVGLYPSTGLFPSVGLFPGGVTAQAAAVLVAGLSSGTVVYVPSSIIGAVA